jgi:polygalacturonase
MVSHSAALFCLSAFLVAASFSAGGPVCVVTEYGAVGDNRTLNTAFLQAALNDCGSRASRSAPSTVVVPAGVFRTGPLSLNSSFVTLELQGGSTLLGSPSPADWNAIAGLPSYTGGGGYWRWQPLLWVGGGATEVHIGGSGKLDGWGDAYFWPAWFNGSLVDPLNMHRPMLLEVHNATNSSVSGISLRRSPFWNLHVFASRGISLTGLDIMSPVGSPNCDGIDVDSSAHVFIADSILATGDDCIAIKSGRGPEGAAYAVPSSFVEVTNVTLLHGLGITLGAESAGGSHDIWVHGVRATNVLAPVHIQNSRWLNPTWAEGGTHRNIIFEDFLLESCFYGLFVNLFWGDIEGSGNGPFPSNVLPPPAPNATTPHLYNVTVRNITGVATLAGAGGMDVWMVGNVQCPPESACSGLLLQDIALAGYKSFSCANVANITAINVQPDPALYGCVGNEAVENPAYHASAFQ